MSAVQEKIWFEDIPGFLTYDNYYIILPKQQMTMEEKLNAIVRFMIYLGILLALVRANYQYLFLGIVALLLSIILYQHERKQRVAAEKFLEKQELDIVENKVCSRSTVDNPFMNPSVADIALNPNHPTACNIENERVKEIVGKNFNAHVFRDVNDIYNKDASERQFYTVPSTTIPNDRTSLANWLYNRGPSCKEGNGEQCWRNKAEFSVFGGGIAKRDTEIF